MWRKLDQDPKHGALPRLLKSAPSVLGNQYDKTRHLSLVIQGEEKKKRVEFSSLVFGAVLCTVFLDDCCRWIWLGTLQKTASFRRDARVYMKSRSYNSVCMEIYAVTLWPTPALSPATRIDSMRSGASSV